LWLLCLPVFNHLICIPLSPVTIAPVPAPGLTERREAEGGCPTVNGLLSNLPPYPASEKLRICQVKASTNKPTEPLVQRAGLVDEPAKDTDGVGDVATRRNSKIKELANELAVWNARHSLLLLRGSRVHRFRELEVLLHGRRKGITVSHVKVLEYIATLGQADSVFDLDTKHGLA
jgi:hypothetical protein